MASLKTKIDTSNKSIAEVEAELGIVDEVDDVRDWNLGHHPSKSYYSGPEPDYAATRREYERESAKYADPEK